MDTPDKKKIIIFSLVYLPEYVGGAEVAMDQITKQSALDEYDFHMITLGSPFAETQRVGNIQVHYTGLLGKNKFLFFISKCLFPFSSCLEYLRLNKKLKFSAIWSLMANQAGGGAIFSKILTPKTKFILTLQEGDSLEHVKKRARRAGPFFKQMFVRADRIQTISHFLKDFAWHVLGKKDDKVVVIPNGVDIALFDKEISAEERISIRAGFGYAPTDKVIVTTSRLTHKNGIDTLIDTVKLLPSEYKLLLIGAGPDETTLKAQVARLSLEDRVTFAGRKAFENLYKYLKSSEIFIRLSRSEGFGNSFIEAMAARIPVVATNVGGIVDFMQDGKNGFLVPPESPEKAKEAILRLGSLESQTFLIQAAYDTVIGKYQWKDIGQSFNTLFKTCL
ncbi:MAG: hypothetical protein RJB39_810 [Candidatus Parcubacteria bacterium]|jgi:glycosyltransferase involved in cell wall biosynthesis